MKQGADIRKVRVVNGEEKLRINVRHDDLVRSFRSGSSIAVYIDTDRTSDSGPEYVFLGATFEGGDYALLPADGFKRTATGRCRCTAARYIMKLDYVEDVARIASTRSSSATRSRCGSRSRPAPSCSPRAAPRRGQTEVDWLGEPKKFTPWVAQG